MALPNWACLDLRLAARKQFHALVVSTKRPIFHVFKLRKDPLGIVDSRSPADGADLDNTLTYIERMSRAVHKLLEEAHPIILFHGFASQMRYA